MKLLLEDPLNVRDLLQVKESPLIPPIAFDQARRIHTTFVQRDYRHVECDLVLAAPFHWRGQPGRRTIVIYILIEHQSKPDERMPLRMLEYVVEVYKYQEREWKRQHPSWSGFRLQPVLPVLFYTGTRRWDTPGRLIDLVELPELFAPFVPGLEPFFLNLRTLDPERLLTAGGFFGKLLHLVQQRKAPAAEFEELLRQEVGALEAMLPGERARWMELLSYVTALVYHDRKPAEHDGLLETIEASMQGERERREVSRMAKTIAETLREEGKKKGEISALRRTLLKQLRKRFGDLPEEIEQAVKVMSSVKQLDQLLEDVVSAHSLEEMGIGQAP
jgi:hypothetical protein